MAVIVLLRFWYFCRKMHSCVYAYLKWIYAYLRRLRCQKCAFHTLPPCKTGDPFYSILPEKFSNNLWMSLILTDWCLYCTGLELSGFSRVLFYSVYHCWSICLSARRFIMDHPIFLGGPLALSFEWIRVSFQANVEYVLEFSWLYMKFSNLCLYL